MERQAILRGIFATILVVSALSLAVGWGTTPPNALAQAADQSETPLSERAQIVPERENVTVVTTDPPGGNKATAALVAFTADGRALYHNETYGNYFDVDPDPPGSRTVLYVAGSRYEQCPSSLQRRSSETFDGGCAKVVIERVNLSTGDTERIHTAVTGWDIWHDVDRIDDDSLLVADIASDRAFVLNTTTGATEWEWRAETDLAADSGGQPGDWTHINDVELLDDGRIMVSLRNHDRVAFLDPESGLQENWTLGAEDAYGILYEQHNPDYIPAERGGPAVVVGDSENNRVAEYQRIDGQWKQSWTWQDDQLRWPRDADRLPDGRTLVTDSQGNRILELNESGTIVWEIDIPTPYEAERLGTGDESATGRSKAALANGTRVNSGSQTGQATGLEWILSFINGPLINGLLYVAPMWMTFWDLMAALVFACTGIVWLLVELYWSRFSIRSLSRRSG